MEDLRTQLNTLARPRLLARAARDGIGHYARKRDLPRVLAPLPDAARLSTGEILVKLLDRERQQERARRARQPSYSLVRHLETLIAIAAEGQLFLSHPPTEPSRHNKTGRSQTGTPEESVSISDLYQRKLSGMDSFLFAT
ncbi:MAG: DUF6477 family protein [Epibacterium sp.]|nr:DUF6477 family protein [Epibacterium sp.]NQX73316.1 hypothetical protein [Epibacterium sp.]